MSNPYDSYKLKEAGPFSYGAKPPRKGSVAYNAMMKRKEQEKNTKPIEPKDQMVGTAKILTKEETSKDPREYDYEGDMAKSQLRSIIANAQQAHDMLDDNTNMAEWVQNKITLAADYISTVADYMKSEVNEETSYNSDDWYLFHKKTHKPAGSVGAKSIVGKNLGSQYKDKPDYDENHYAVRGMSVKSHLASLKKNEEVDSSREKIFKNSKDKMKELFKNAHPEGNKRSDV